jgi:chromosomal replication initiation ATPase DnaA
MTPSFKRRLNKKSTIDLLEVRQYIDRLLAAKMDAKINYELKPSYQQTVLRELAAFWKIPSEAAITKRRFSDAMNYKHAIRYAIRTVTKMPYVKMGAMLNCDHATIIHSMKFVNDAAMGDIDFYVQCIGLSNHLRNVLAELRFNENQPTLHEIPSDIYFHN